MLTNTEAVTALPESVLIEGARPGSEETIARRQRQRELIGRVRGGGRALTPRQHQELRELEREHPTVRGAAAVKQSRANIRARKARAAKKATEAAPRQLPRGAQKVPTGRGRPLVQRNVSAAKKAGVKKPLKRNR